MKLKSKIITQAVLGLLVLILPVSARAQLKVVTTTTDLAAIAEAIGGPDVEVVSLTRGNQDPHYIEPKPSFARRLNQADLLIFVGLGLEVGWLPVLLTQSRNPRIQGGQAGHLDASKGIPVLEVPVGRIDRSGGDVHPEGNPHYWLDPRNGIIIAQHIANRLVALNPERKQVYEMRRDAFQSDLRRQIDQWKTALDTIKDKRTITYHRTFSYFAAWAGMDVVNVIEPKPGIPPSPAHLLKLVQQIARDKIPIILTANYSSPKAGEELAERTGANFLWSPVSVGGVPQIHNYPGLFDYLVRSLRENL